MSASQSPSANRRLVPVAVLLLPLLTAGCADYLNHHDTVTSSAGDAVAHNMVVHIADPWPRAAADTRITGNGKRVDAVTKRYLAGPRENTGSGSGAAGGLPAPASPPSE